MKVPRDFYTNPGRNHHRYGGASVPLEDVEKLRTRPLVPHGFKCPRGCGATLVPADPLPHECGQPSFGVGDYGRCLL